MTYLTIDAVQWTRLRDLHEIAPLDNDDLACMRAVREVLMRHGRLERFALHLVHKHFDLAAGEVLVEYSDVTTREQRLRVEPRDSATARDAVPTTWLLANDRPEVVCVCAMRSEQGHLGRHESA